MKRPFTVAFAFFFCQFPSQNSQKLRFQEDFMECNETFNDEKEDFRLSVSEPDAVFNLKLICKQPALV